MVTSFPSHERKCVLWALVQQDENEHFHSIRPPFRNALWLVWAFSLAICSLFIPGNGSKIFDIYSVGRVRIIWRKISSYCSNYGKPCPPTSQLLFYPHKVWTTLSLSVGVNFSTSTCLYIQITEVSKKGIFIIISIIRSECHWSLCTLYISKVDHWIFLLTFQHLPLI